MLCCSTFESPQPSYRLIADATSHLKCAISRSLKLGVSCSNILEIEFRVDVFRYLFHGKGHKPQEDEDYFTTYKTSTKHILEMIGT